MKSGNFWVLVDKVFTKRFYYIKFIKEELRNGAFMKRYNDTVSIETEFRIRIADVTSVMEVRNRVEELLGYCPNDFLSGKVSLVDRIHSDDLDIAEEIFASEPTDDPHTVNLRLRQANGRIRCIKATYQKYTEDNSDRIVLELLLQDAKSLTRTLDEATNIANFQAMMENTDDYIYFKDRNHVFTGASQTLVTLCDPAEHWTDLLGQTDYDVFPEEYADIYYSLEKQVFAGIPVAHEIQETFSIEGKKGWVDNRKYPIHDEQGEIIGLYGIARDITDRIQAEKELEGMNERLKMEIGEHKCAQEALKKSEMRFRRLFEATDAISVQGYDKNRRVIYWNPASEKLYGYPADKAIGKKLEDLIIPDTMREPVIAAVTAWIDEGIAIPSSELTLCKADGSSVHVFSSHVMFLNQKNEQEMYCIDVDLTERKQVEEEKERLEHELQHSQKMESLGHLTGGIAHEFNNLLGVINGYTELAITKCINQGDKKLLKYMRNIETAGGRATRLVAEMLAFGRSKQADDLPLNISSIILEDTYMLRSTLPSTIEIETKIDQHLPSVLMDPTQLNQILMNLSINARDAMDGMGKLTVRLRMRHGLDAEDSVSHKPIKGDWIELSVSDTGSGIEPEIVKNIFNPFFTTKEVGKGTGMGLSIIYRIMEDHNGHILLDNDPGKGTTFRLLFPPMANEATENSDLTEESSEIPEGDDSEILIVDDEEMLAAHMSELVKSYGYKAHYVTDSTEALNLFKQDPERFSILITDQTMPKMTGKELIEKLREIRPELPVIMCSGYSDKINSDEASELNISYFSKPVDVSGVMREISNLLVLRN